MKQFYILVLLAIVWKTGAAQSTLPVEFNGKTYQLQENADLTITFPSTEDSLMVTYVPMMDVHDPDLVLTKINVFTYKFSSSSFKRLRENLNIFTQLILTLASDNSKTLTVNKAPEVIEAVPEKPIAEPVKVTGSMVLDALKMDSLEANSSPELFNDFKAKIITAYKIDPDQNPFAQLVGLSLQKGGFVSQTSQEPSSLLSKAMGLNVTNLADGLARFFVKRTKQELNAAFFEKLKTVLDDPRYRDLKLIFPATHTTLQALGDEIYNFEAYLTTLRESFQQDLKSLPPHLQKWLDEGTLSSYLATHREVRATAFTALYIYDQISNDVHPGEMIADFPVKELVGLKTIPASIRGTDYHIRVDGVAKAFIEISKSLASNDDKSYWVSEKTIKELLKNEKARMYYLAMLYEQIKEVQVLDEGKTMGDFLVEWSGDVKREIEPRTRMLGTFISQTKKLEQKIKLARDGDIPDSLRFERYFTVFEEFSTTLRSGYTLAQSWLSIPSLGDSKFDRVLSVADNAAMMGLYTARRKYGSAIIQGVSLYNFLVEDASDSEDITLSGLKNVASKKIRLTWNKAAPDLKTQGAELVKQLNANGLPAVYDDVNNELKVSISGQADLKIALASTLGDTFKQFKSGNPKSDVRRFSGKIIIKLPVEARERHIIESPPPTVNLKQNAKTVVDGLIRYGSMMAAVSEAKNSQEVADAIEAFALPAGSSSIKRKSVFNVALNGYTGLLAGHEKGNGLVNSWAVWAPVGITASIGNLGRGHSFSLFASIIDIGAVTAFRFKDKELAVAKIELKDIVSPGAAVSWGIAKTPLSLALGWQAAPTLRAVGAGGSTTVDIRASRFQLTLAVDIPLMNFYNKKEKKLK